GSIECGAHGGLSAGDQGRPKGAGRVRNSHSRRAQPAQSRACAPARGANSAIGVEQYGEARARIGCRTARRCRDTGGKLSRDIDHLRSWIGRKASAEDTITPFPVAALAATLDRDDPEPRPGDALPPLWHWLYFLPIARHSELAEDGHLKRGGFLPPVPLPRR